MKFIPDEVRAKTWAGRLGFQIADELDEFLSIVRGRDVRSYLEIGSRDGDTFHAVMSALPAGSKGVAVDLPGDVWGNAKSGARLIEAVDDLKRRGYDVTALFGDSRAEAVIRDVGSRGPYDAVFIDGDHRYEGVKADWENYGPMSRIVAFHDIAGDGYSVKKESAVIEVERLWKEIRDGFEHVEIVSPGSIMGIGVLIR